MSQEAAELSTSPSTPPPDVSNLEELCRLQLENSLLLAERSFLQRELGACPAVSARVSTARQNGLAAECELLRCYYFSLQNKDRQSCKLVKDQLLAKVAERRRMAATLESLLRSVQEDVEKVVSQCE